MPYMNHVSLMGHMVTDPEMRTANNGNTIANLRIAWNKFYKQNNEWKSIGHFFDVTAFGPMAETAGEKGKKGMLVLVEGEMNQQRWETSEGQNRSKVVIIARRIVWFREKHQDGSQQEDTASYASDSEGDDDVPF